MGERRCPACAGEVAVGRGAKNGVALAECRACATLYAESAPAAFDYDGYYDEANLSVPEVVGARLDEIFASFAPYRRTNRLLDIGCGAGSLLEAARRAGWEAFGTEVSPPAVEHARRAGFEVFHGDLGGAPYPDGHFDVVTASEIIEHLADPRAMIRQAARVLRPGGLFWATTPHGRGLTARVLGLRWSVVAPPEHLQLFSLGGLRRMLREAGFRRARVASRGFDPFEIWRVLRGSTGAGRANGAASAGAATGEQPALSEGCARVESGYRLNAALMSNGATRAAKAALNAALGATRLGDSIKVWAEK
ncbi:MAG TPA: class I SAM-dependent methyltransferase [Pyrinomonadaceae bacterium]|nr:class I SAM-dependent methyltransferase [Pyrinomonadaceae bacterium]